MPPQPAANEVLVLMGGDASVDLTRPLPLAGGGLPAFAASDRRSGNLNMIAVAVARNAPARAQAIQHLNGSIDNVAMPRGYVIGPAPDGGQSGYVICTAPQGQPVSSSLQPWSEAALISRVLRPLALVLDELQERGITHRAIRAANVFDPGGGQPLVLGVAWAAPPAMHQPALYEPAYSAACHPVARGNGSIADDVYSLGVLLIVLALGRVPLAGLDDAAVLSRKLEFGSYAALMGDARLSPLISDLVRGMLAQDPEHRPSPALLLDPLSARGRRVAARPPRRAGRSLPIGRTLVWDAHTLAYAMGREPDAGLAGLRGGDIMHWLRRSLGDASLAVRLEEVLRLLDASAAQRGHGISDAETVMRAIAVIDPLAPLFWRGVGLWPDGLGTLLVMALEDPVLMASLEELLTCEIVGVWASLRPERCNPNILRQDARQQRAWLRTRGPGGGLPRLAYALNPLLPCRSPAVRHRWVSRLHELVPTLEEAAGEAESDTDPVDAQVAAFVAARGERQLDTYVSALEADSSPEGRALGRLRLLAHLQGRYHPKPLPRLAGWLAARGEPLIELWRNRTRRKQTAARLKELAAEGMLAPIVALLDDPSARLADLQGAENARAEYVRIEQELAALATSGEARRRRAVELGQECAAGFGLATLTLMLILAALE
jgi:eukaryotic-like serine/threonine-protein kinase